MRNAISADCEAFPTLIKKIDAAANADAVATQAADSEQFWVLDSVVWSYDGAPTGGKLTIAFGSEMYEFDITSAGPGILEFERPIYTGTKNEALTITLAAGGAGVTGKVWARIR